MRRGLTRKLRSLRERGSVERQAEPVAAEQDGVLNLLFIDGTRVRPIIRRRDRYTDQDLAETLRRNYAEVGAGWKYTRILKVQGCGLTEEPVT